MRSSSSAIQAFVLKMTRRKYSLFLDANSMAYLVSLLAAMPADQHTAFLDAVCADYVAQSTDNTITLAALEPLVQSMQAAYGQKKELPLHAYFSVLDASKVPVLSYSADRHAFTRYAFHVALMQTCSSCQSLWQSRHQNRVFSFVAALQKQINIFLRGMVLNEIR